ncbi:hypothetical protein Q5P01_012275 [Channa striata]|uniref:Uncharacterized protein n=1 Tax=Channa striata TaxID=64152 RepID=A0AA88MPE9_CHASR|nr:hypothetical protein Q5P01_012275 [Channa striata]
MQNSGPLTGRFNLLSLTADKACLKNNGVEEARIGYNWHNVEMCNKDLAGRKTKKSTDGLSPSLPSCHGQGETHPRVLAAFSPAQVCTERLLDALLLYPCANL